MNGRMAVRPQHAILFVVIGIIAATVFWLLTVALRGFVISILVATAVVVVLGGLQYLLWGHEFSSKPAARRAEAETAARREAAREAVPEEIPLYLTDQERLELIRLLQAELHEAHIGAAEGPSPHYQETARREENVLRSLLEKVRSYGA